MKKKYFTARILVAATLACSIFTAPFTQKVAEATTVKATSGVNLRSSSSSHSARIGHIQEGSYARYLGTVNGYYKLSVNGKVGYAHHSYWKGHKVTATHDVNMRTSPRSTSSRIAYIHHGSDARVLGRTGDWLYIEHNGRRGYAHKSYWFMSQTLFRSCSYVSSGIHHDSGMHH